GIGGSLKARGSERGVRGRVHDIGLAEPSLAEAQSSASQQKRDHGARPCLNLWPRTRRSQRSVLCTQKQPCASVATATSAINGTTCPRRLVAASQTRTAIRGDGRSRSCSLGPIPAIRLPAHPCGPASRRTSLMAVAKSGRVGGEALGLLRRRLLSPPLFTTLGQGAR